MTNKDSKRSTIRRLAPDFSALETIPYPSDEAIQPDWISERHPKYAHDRGMRHELTSVRTAEHRGHSIKITTSYKIEIDGHPVNLHVRVGDDGRLHCHSTPYEPYRTAVDLVKALIDRFPEAFAEMTAAQDCKPGHHEHMEVSHDPTQHSQ